MLSRFGRLVSSEEGPRRAVHTIVKERSTDYMHFTFRCMIHRNPPLKASVFLPQYVYRIKPNLNDSMCVWEEWTSHRTNHVFPDRLQHCVTLPSVTDQFNFRLFVRQCMLYGVDFSYRVDVPRVFSLRANEFPTCTAWLMMRVHQEDSNILMNNLSEMVMSVDKIPDA